MNLNQHIKSILKERSTMPEFGGDKNTKFIKNAVEEYVTFEICKLSVINLAKEEYAVIILTEKPIRTDYRDELSRYLNDISPLTIYVVIEDGIFGCGKPKMYESSKSLKTDYMKYDKLLSKMVDEVFSENICGFTWEVFKLEHLKGTQIRIILNIKNMYNFDFEVYGRKKQELKELISDFFPMFNGIFILTDTTKCGEDLNESEITERCWKGYTQKGMKTMFGKRYPNCVKIKKKKESKESVVGYAAPAFEMEPDHVHFKHSYNESNNKRYHMKNLKESIKNILHEEVNRKYSKPTPKVEQLVYRWLNDYFDGAQMYHKKHYESTHTFEFCKNGKEILDVTLYFDTDYSVGDDKRKTEERDLDKGLFIVPKNVFDDLTTDLPMRISYLRYILEEWFDDTYLGEIQKKMGRNDIYISEVSISNSDGDICFPPITKPDDVTEEEMIEHILNSGKYKMDEILWWEERLPGWIEQTYLEQLNGAEYRRLKGQ